MEVKDWYCCLNPVELNVLALSSTGAALTGFTFIPEAVFNAYWPPWIPSRAARMDTFKVIFGLSSDTMPGEDPETVIDILTIADPLLWGRIALYALSIEGTCSEGCKRWFPPIAPNG